MLDASGNRETQAKIQFKILKSAAFDKKLDCHEVLQIPGRVDSSFIALTRIANQGGNSAHFHDLCINVIGLSFRQTFYIGALF